MRSLDLFLLLFIPSLLEACKHVDSISNKDTPPQAPAVIAFEFKDWMVEDISECEEACVRSCLDKNRDTIKYPRQGTCMGCATFKANKYGHRALPDCRKSYYGGPYLCPGQEADGFYDCIHPCLDFQITKEIIRKPNNAESPVSPAHRY